MYDLADSDVPVVVIPNVLEIKPTQEEFGHGTVTEFNVPKTAISLPSTCVGKTQWIRYR